MSAWSNIISAVRRPESGYWQSESLQQFKSVLTVRLAAALSVQPSPPPQEVADFANRVMDLIKGDKVTWRDAFEAELFLIFALSENLVDRELDQKLQDCLEKGVAGVAERRAVLDGWEKAAQPTTSGPSARLSAGELLEKKRSMLLAVSTDLQNRSLRNYQIRSMRREAVRAVTVMTPAAMLLVGLPFIFYVMHLFFSDDAGNSFFSDFVASFPNYGLFTAISFGGLGALFSRFLVLQQSDLQVSVDDAAAYYSFRYILLRVIVGIVGAIIVYFFVGTGLVEGDLVPKITRLSFQPAVLDPNGQKGVLTLFGRLTSTAMVPTKDFALLVIWSFLAGFSERLVPNLLSTTSERIEERYKQQTPTERTTAAPGQ